MLIKCKNPDLYRAWLAYLARVTGKQDAPQRTEAFFNSEAAIPVPL